ncbi:MAG: PspC domain-containing protein [Proteobacteria bacterium]|nr:PspC domain-containing protein [Pseudomonadota bacterium]
MQTNQTSLIARDDTFFGVCQAIGDDLGFNPLWLRLVLATGVLWNPTAMFAIYAGLGVIVLASRLMFPAAKRQFKAEAPAVEAARPQNDDSKFELAQAA